MNLSNRMKHTVIGKLSETQERERLLFCAQTLFRLDSLTNEQSERVAHTIALLLDRASPPIIRPSDDTKPDDWGHDDCDACDEARHADTSGKSTIHNEPNLNTLLSDAGSRIVMFANNLPRPIATLRHVGRGQYAGTATQDARLSYALILGTNNAYGLFMTIGEDERGANHLQLASADVTPLQAVCVSITA